MVARVLTLVATAVTGAVLLALGGPAEGPLLRATAGGSLQLESSRDGQAILTAAGLRPGRSAEGSLTLHNRAAQPQRLRLALAGLEDTPGPGGGALSSWLDLRIERGGDEVFTGKLADLPDLDLGDLAPGESVAFRFVVSLPELGPAVDSAYAGARVEVGWTWRGDVDGDPTPPRVEDPPAPALPPVADDPVAPYGDPAPPAVDPDTVEGPLAPGAGRVRLWLGGRSRQRLGRSLSISALCRPGCTLRAAAKVKVGRRWRALGRRTLGTVAATGRPHVLAFRLSKLQQRSLRATLARRGALTVRIQVTALTPGRQRVTKVRTLRISR